MTIPPTDDRPDRAEAERIFDAYLEGMEQGDEVDFETVCNEHPTEADELRLMKENWSALGPTRTVNHGDTVSFFRGSTETESTSAGPWNVAEGETLGDFRLVRRIGRGGMGEVWEAEQFSLSRRVALKLLLPERVDQRGLDFFAREARAGGRLAHQNIVSVYGTGEDGGLHWISMELVEEGCDLRRTLDSFREEEGLGAPYYRHVAEFIADLAGALGAAHDAGVIHRDLKPANILVTRDDRPKVSDFGLAKLVDEHSLSVAGELAGSYFYMSPEQVASKRAGLDHRTDIFSLGVVFYEMLALVRPFEGDTTEQVVGKILWEDPLDPRTIRSRVPRDLALICTKAMEKEPARRYQTMAEFAADLRRHLANKPIAAKPAGISVRMTKWVRRNPTKSVAGVITVVALVTVSYFWWRAEEANEATVVALEQSQQERDRARRVAEFQSGMLTSLDAFELGRTLLAGFEEGIENQLTNTQWSEEEVAEKLAIFRELALRAPPIDVAKKLLDEEILVRAAQAIEEGFGDDPLTEATLRHALANVYEVLGLYEEALSHQERTLEIQRRELGNEHFDTLHSISDVGDLLQDQGKHDEAEPFLSEALERARRMLGDDHQVTLKSINNLASLLQHQGDLAEAEPLFRAAVEGLRSTLGDVHPDTLTSINNLGLLLKEREMYDEAELLLREALEGLRRTLGDGHRVTLIAIHNLGILFKAQGNFDEAEVFYREALAGFRRTLGDEHPVTLVSIKNLGTLLQDRRSLDEAEFLCREALKGNRKLFGAENQDVLTSTKNLGDLLVLRGKFGEAESLYREALEIDRRTLGDEHPDTLDLIHNLGSMLLLTPGRFAEAEPHLREVVEGRRRTLGDEHQKTLQSINNLGSLLVIRGKLDEAEPLVRELLQKTPEDHPKYVEHKQLLDDILSLKAAAEAAPADREDEDDG